MKIPNLFKFALIGIGIACLVVFGVFAKKWISGKENVAVSASSIATVNSGQFAHYYDNKAIKLKNIRIDYVYFVPKELEYESYPEWQKTFDLASKDLKLFFETQFGDFINIENKIYIKPVIGLNETSYYNGENTDRGNPNGLLRIEEELNKRLYSESGDLYDAAFKKSENTVLAIIYEGVGASGSGEDRTFMLAREFLTREPIKSTYGITFLAHEFAHALGMPDFSHKQQDELDPEVVFTSDDLMGSGRYKPLKYTYLSGEIKTHMISHEAD